MSFENETALFAAVPDGSYDLTETVTVGEKSFYVAVSNNNLTIQGANAQITIPGNISLNTVTVDGENAKLVNNGTIINVICNKKCEVINNSTVTAVTVNAENCKFTNSTDAAVIGNFKMSGTGSAIENYGEMHGVSFYANSSLNNYGTMSVSGSNDILLRIFNDSVGVNVTNAGIMKSDYYIYWIEVNNAQFIVTNRENCRYTEYSSSNSLDDVKIYHVANQSGNNPNTTYNGSKITVNGKVVVPSQN